MTQLLQTMRGIMIPWVDKARKHKVLSLIVACLIVVCFIGLVLAAGRKEPTSVALPPLQVEVIQVKQTDVPVYSEWIGTTDGLINANIQAQVSGYLVRRNYTEGSFVKQGQLLFEIDPRPFEAILGQAQGQLGQVNAQLQQAQANLAQGKSQLLQAQAQLKMSLANQLKSQLDVDKYTPLLAKKAVTQQDLDNAVQANLAAIAQIEASKAVVETAESQVKAFEAAVGTAKATIVMAQAAIKTAELNLGFTKITSPIDGVVGIAQAQVGDLVNPTSGIITTVSTVDPIRVYFNVSEQEYLDFSKRNLIAAEPSESVGSLELELILSDGTTYPQKGKLFISDRQVDQQTGAIRVAGIFANPGNTLRPGQYARVRAAATIQKGALLIPQRSVTELQGTFRIAVVDSDNKISIRPVTLGPQIGSMWTIQDGLKPGDKVVAMGTQRLTPGQLVSPRPYIANAAQQ